MMEIKHIIVDELPENCRHCLLSKLKPRKNSLFDLMCMVTNKYTKTKKIPDWCPLEVDKNK